MGLGSLRQTVTGDIAREWWVSFNQRFFFFFFFFSQNLLPSEIDWNICWNGQNSLKLVRIWLKVKQVVLRYWTTCRYEIFQLFQTEQFEINNIGFYPLLLYLFLLMEGQFSIYRLTLINGQTNQVISFKPHGREKVFYKAYLSQHIWVLRVDKLSWIFLKFRVELHYLRLQWSFCN